MDDPDFAARHEIVVRHASAKITMWRGVVSLSSIPLVIVAMIAVAALGADPTMVMLIAFAHAVVAGTAGLGLLAFGARNHAKASKQLRSLDASRQLPAARVIER